MKGVISASVSAGSSHRVASVTWAATVTGGGLGVGGAGAEPGQGHQDQGGERSERTAATGHGAPPAISHRGWDGQRLPRVNSGAASGRLALDPLATTLIGGRTMTRS